MIHPSKDYALSTMSPGCLFEGKEVEVSEYARDPETQVRYYSAKCECAWAGTNLQYLEYLYEKNLCK